MTANRQAARRARRGGLRRRLSSGSARRQAGLRRRDPLAWPTPSRGPQTAVGVVRLITVDFRRHAPRQGRARWPPAARWWPRPDSHTSRDRFRSPSGGAHALPRVSPGHSGSAAVIRRWCSRHPSSGNHLHRSTRWPHCSPGRGNVQARSWFRRTLPSLFRRCGLDAAGRRALDSKYGPRPDLRLGQPLSCRTATTPSSNGLPPGASSRGARLEPV